MKNASKKYLILLLLIVCVLLLNQQYEAKASDKYIYGKVLYSDNLTPVSEGNIKVYMYSGLSKSEVVIEKTTINANGEFKISVPPLTANGIKIMAYPNEIDNIQNLFEKKVIDYELTLKSREGEREIIIRVEKAGSNNFQGKLNFDEKENIILKQNFPNPFNPTTSIRFVLPNTSEVTLKIYNMNGADVATLIENKNLSQGINEVEFNAGDLPSGIYIYSLNADNYTENRKMILLK